MKTTAVKPAPSTRKVSGKETKQKSNSESAHGLRDLFVYELKDMYWAEKAMTKAIPKMIKNATSLELIEVLNEHLDETMRHVTRLEEVFSFIGEKAEAVKCESMTGLLAEAEEVMGLFEKGEVRDAGIILSAQKVEHYEIAAYGTLCSFARTLKEYDAVALLEDTLMEEKDIDEVLTEIAEASVNGEAAHEYADDSDTIVAVKSKKK